MDKQTPRAKPGPLAGQSPKHVDFELPGPSPQGSHASVDEAMVSILTERLTASATEMRDEEPASALELVRRGLPFAAFENLVQAVGAPQREVARAVGMAATTLGRRRKDGRLTPVESDHVMRIARLAALARELMAGDPDAASAWLRTPHALLDEETPLSIAATETGGREVERLIGQLRHGVFS